MILEQTGKGDCHYVRRGLIFDQIAGHAFVGEATGRRCRLVVR